MLQYYPRHVPSIKMPIFRRKCSKHVKDNSVTYILLINKELCIKVGYNEIILYYDARSTKLQNTRCLFST